MKVLSDKPHGRERPMGTGSLSEKDALHPAETDPTPHTHRARCTFSLYVARHIRVAKCLSLGRNGLLSRFVSTPSRRRSQPRVGHSNCFVQTVIWSVRGWPRPDDMVNLSLYAHAYEGVRMPHFGGGEGFFPLARKCEFSARGNPGRHRGTFCTAVRATPWHGRLGRGFTGQRPVPR
jgi:hypothetical protein